MKAQEEIFGAYYLRNGEICSSREFDAGFLKKGLNVYEVFRTMDGIPLFLDDHCRRFQQSLQRKGLPYICEIADIKRMVSNLLDRLDMKEGNLKLVYHFSDLSDVFLLLYPVRYSYPDASQYLSGVRAEFFHGERPEPHLKNWLPDFKARVAAFKQSSGCYELVLLDNHGRITEGSQSNIFFVERRHLVTPPSEQVLEGITRNYVFQLAAGLSLKVHERIVIPPDLYHFQAAFITGTSPKILPLNQIGTFSFHPDHPVVKQLSTAYDRRIVQYLESYQK